MLRLSNRRSRKRRGIATVEFALCAPILFLLGFGFINAGILVQLKHNSKMIGHLTATEVFKGKMSTRQIESKFEGLATDLGIQEFELEIKQHTPEIAVINTKLSVSKNSSIPPVFLTAESIATTTFVYSKQN